MSGKLNRGVWAVWDKQTDKVMDTADKYSTIEEYAASKVNDFQNRRVAKDQVGPFEVSTVFLTVDHSFTYPPPPIEEGLWFETMVFADGGEDRYQERYHTAAEARAGHSQIVKVIEEEIAKKGDAAKDWTGYEQN